MKYDLVREHIGTGDVFLFRGNRWYSRLIRWRTQSVYSHVGMALWIEVSGTAPRLAIMEALEPHGVRLYPFRRYLEDCTRQRVGVDWFKLDTTSVKRDLAAGYVLEQWGKRYAAGQVVVSFGVVSGWIRRLFGLSIPLVDGAEEKFFCSELAAAAVEAGGYKPDDLDESLPAAIDPGSVALFPCLHRMGTLSI